MDRAGEVHELHGRLELPFVHQSELRMIGGELLHRRAQVDRVRLTLGNDQGLEPPPILPSRMRLPAGSTALRRVADRIRPRLQHLRGDRERNWKRHAFAV